MITLFDQPKIDVSGDRMLYAAFFAVPSEARRFFVVLLIVEELLFSADVSRTEF